MRFIKNNGLSLAFFALFLVFLAGHAISGYHVYNDDQKDHQQPEVRFQEYLHTGQFEESVAENWESEFFQMAVFVLLSALLFQKGSAESNPLAEVEKTKTLHKRNVPWPVRHGGVILKIYENSLFLALFLLFLFSFVFHVGAGLKQFNHERLLHRETSVGLVRYLESSQFWFESFQNWQSEFLSVFALILLSIYLRQKGSSQSKPVDAPHPQTGA